MRILLGMSGGIDSSVAAILLQKEGYEVIGVTLRLWSEADSSKSDIIPDYIIEAQELASKLNIKHHIIDVREEFYNSVILYFKSEYLKGRTPNPCAKCNVVLKWKVLNELAIEQDCNLIATGHYVNKTIVNNKHYITKGIDPDKEQSFFLWGLSQVILTKAIFPLGNLTKKEVKEVANKHGFYKLESKKESTGVCFIDGNKYQPFILKLLKGSKQILGEGNFINASGSVLGKHTGFPFYTVGQRRGLGLETNEPYYITRIDAYTNNIQLGSREDLYCNEMFVDNYIIIDKSDFEEEVITRIRYRKQSALSRVEFIDNNVLRVKFIEPEWSIAPGQTAAFYIGDRLLGGGFIVG